MHPAQLMYRLQEIDGKISTVQQRLVEIAARLGESEEVIGAQSEVEIVDEQLRIWNRSLREREMEVKQVASKIASSKDRLYGGKVRNPKELKSLDEELESLDRRRSNVEEGVLEAMMQIEELEESLVAKQSRLQELSSAWKGSQNELLTEQSELASGLAQLREKRRERVVAVGENMGLYEDLHRRRAGRPVALLRDGMCKACGMSLPTGEVQRITYTQDLCACPNCGRFLWAS